MDDLKLGAQALSLLGIVLLLIYADWTGSATDLGSKDHLASRWWHHIGVLAGILGPLLLLVLAIGERYSLFP